MAPAAATPHAKKRKAAPTPQKDDADSKSAEKVSAKKPKVDKPATKAVADKPVVPVTKAPVVEEAFPRGGASALTPLEYREVSDQAKQDVLFETPEAKPKPKSKKRRAEDGKAEEDSAKKARTEGTTHAEMLSFKRLNVGMTLLGCIKEINDLDIAISLPDQLTGYVSITEISDYITAQVEKAAGDNEDSEEDEEEESEESVPELREYFGLGQVVSCVITALEHDADSEGKAGSGRRRVALSLKPELVNANISSSDLVEGLVLACSIVSEEDHGFILSVGIEGASGFLLKKNAKAFVEKQNEGRPLKIGQVLHGNVLKVDEARKVVSVTLDPEVQAKAVVPATQVIAFDALKAGALVNAKVKDVLDNGILLTFLGVLEGTVNLAHLGSLIVDPEEELPAKYKVGQRLRVRVLYVDPIRKKIAATLSPSLLHFVRFTPPAVEIGSIFDDFVVRRIDAKLGLLVEQKDAGFAFVHISRLSDTKVEKMDKNYKVGSKHRGRVTGIDYCDGLLHVSFQKSVLEQPFLRYDEIKPGMAVKGQVAKLLPNGAIISLAGSITGFCPKLHFADIALTQPEKMFKTGVVLKFLVLSVDAKNRKVTLTHKKSILNSTLPKVASYEDVKSGDIVHGVIMALKDFGCLVSFFGDVRALAPISELSEKFVEKAADVVTLGQVVKCRVLNVDAAAEKMRVSFKLLGGAEGQASLEAEKVGEIASATVISVMPSGLLVELRPSLARGYLAKSHLSDHTGNVEKLHKGFQERSVLKEVVIIGKDEKRGHAIISMKSLLIEETKRRKAAFAFDDIEEGMLVPGFVKNITDKRCFVSLVGGVVVAAISHNISDRYVTKVEDFLQIGQTVVAVVTKVDKEDHKIEISLKHSQCSKAENALRYETELLRKRAIKGAIDPGFKSLDDYSLGATVKAKIASVKDTQLNMTLGSNLKGRVHITQVYDCIEDITDLKHPLHHFKIGDIIECKVIGFHDAKTHRTLPFSHRKNPSHTVVELTVKPSELALPEGRVSTETEVPPTLDTLQSGAKYVGFTQSVDEDALWIHIGPNLLGRAHLMDHPNPVALKRPHKFFPTGSAVQCWVVRANSERKILDLSLKVPGHHDTVEVGAKFNGKVKKVEAGKGLLVQISPALTGRVYLTDITDEYVKDPLEGFRVGGIVECVVIGSDTVNKRLDLSLRHSRTKPTEDAEVPNPEVKDIGDVVNDTVVSGYIRSISDGGVFVGLNHNLAARVKISELSDAFIKNWKEAYTVGQLVRGRIVNVNADQNRIEMSLKQSVVDPEAAGVQIKWNDIEQGQKVKGTVKAILEFGIFIQLANSAITGLCHKTELSDSPVTAIDKLYSVGDAVKALVLKVDREAKKLSLSLKASHFDETDYADDAKVMEMDESGSDAESDIDEPTAALLNSFVNLPDESDDEDDEQEEQEGLDVGGFNWDGTSAGANAAGESDDEDGAEGSDDEDESTQTGKKKTRRAKQRAKREEEERIAQKEQSLLEGDQPPEVAEDFERLLLGSPNSSFLWIKFMAFQLQMAEVEKARQVAERALKSISFREEQEKMNVWVALMNLENSYGTQESLLKVFERAVSMNEPKAVYIQLIKIYERTEKWDQAEQLHQVATKKFNKSSKIWTSFGLFQLKRGKVEEARKILQRSLQSLAKRKHVKTICKFAQMEFKYGEPERGRTIFEGIMSNYPKRVDLWSVYLDMEIRNGDVSITRRLFERVIALKFSSKKMKFFFKKYLDFEKKNGTPETVNHVKQAAVAYVESLQN
ncbi:uncharacterized protein EV422DRAFT_495369 [Fimicolochytrium jonesii]|uniref:uncharacterized protein n=1 Tax=Fimicolochytrium jonesii TaxID=1396493 RepID=UPI0022FE9D52|nr:uncharacterized protein EV422DRAFT_495369 [Fimicolochytrium jonesii]KAI8821806.1 hypothetical protein EV422DRAFT_495369 [Fimicolochytrium jonesii]